MYSQNRIEPDSSVEFVWETTNIYQPYDEILNNSSTSIEEIPRSFINCIDDDAADSIPSSSSSQKSD